MVGDVWPGYLHPVLAVDDVNAPCFAFHQGPDDGQDDVEHARSTFHGDHTTVTGSTNHENDEIDSTGAIDVGAPVYRARFGFELFLERCSLYLLL